MSWRSQREISTSSWQQILSAARRDARGGERAAVAAVASALELLNGVEPSVRDQELGEDLSFLAQHLRQCSADQLQQSEPGKCSRTSLCRLITAVLQAKRVQLGASATKLLCGTLRYWADGSVAECGGSGDGSSMLQIEALAGLGALIPDNYSHLAAHERTALLTLLQALITPAKEATAVRREHATELQRLALQALAACCGRGSSDLSPDEAMAILASVCAALAGCTSCARPVEDAPHAQLYAALLRALQAAILETKRGWVARAPVIVEGLRRFLLYGVQVPGAPAAGSQAAGPAAAAQASSSSPAAGASAEGGVRYRPPHLRRRDPAGDNGMSDSDVSDSEHASGGGSAGMDRFKSSRVRLGVLTCLQAMAKSDSRALHGHWTTLLPTQAPLVPRPLSPTLVTMLLFDPQLKVRGLAAATICVLLEGPAQRGFLAVAEAKAMVQRAPVRGFVTLSLSLGQMALATHAGLLAAVAREPSAAVLGGALRALCVLLSASPYERLPAELMPEVVKAVRARWAALSAPGGGSSIHPLELAQVHSAAMACIAEAFSTKQPLPGLASYLQQPEAGCGQMISELLALCQDKQAALRIEALAALKGLAGHYPFVLPDIWVDVRGTVAFCLSESGAAMPPSPTHQQQQQGAANHQMSHATHSQPPPNPQRPQRGFGRGAPERAAPPSSSLSAAGGSLRPQPGPGPAAPGSSSGAAATSSSSGSPEEKAAQLAVKLMSDYLGALARYYGLSRSDAAGGAADSDLAPGLVSPSAAARAAQQVLSPGSAATDEEVEAAVVRLAGMWREALEEVLPAAAAHNAYMVRSAALACMDEIPEAVFAHLAPELQRATLQLLTHAAARDTAAAVRGAACRALGIVATFPAVIDDAHLTSLATAALGPCIKDTVVSVRVSAGWAVANACDALRRRLEPPKPSPLTPASAAPTTTTPSTERATSHSLASTSAPSPTKSKSQRRFPLVLRPAPLAQPLAPHQLQQLSALCGMAVVAVGDVDKARANGIRAVGHLLAAVTPSLGLEPEGGFDAWLDAALAGLQSCMTTGNMKVQWNACYAALGLFQNAPLLASERAAARRGPLLLLLVMLVRDSANFKIRTHAAAALAALPGRDAYGDVFADALLVVAGALEGLAGGGAGGRGPAAGASAASDRPPSGSGYAGAPAPPSASGPASAQLPGASDANEGEDGRFPNYRYAAGLAQQLRATLMHLVALARAGDAPRMREALAKRADVMLLCLQDAVAEAVATLRPAAMVIMVPQGPAAAAGSPGSLAAAAMGLPTDPFGLSPAPVAGQQDVRCGTNLIAALDALQLGQAAVMADGVGVGAGGSTHADGALRVAVPQLAAEAEVGLQRLRGAAASLAGFAELMQALGPPAEGQVAEAQALLQALLRQGMWNGALAGSP